MGHLDASTVSAMCRGFLNTFRGAEQPEGESRGDASTSGEMPLLITIDGMYFPNDAMPMRSTRLLRPTGLLQVKLTGRAAGNGTL